MQFITTKPARQSVLAVHFFLKFLMKELSAVCCWVATSCERTEAWACASGWTLPGVALLTSKT